MHFKVVLPWEIKDFKSSPQIHEHTQNVINLEGRWGRLLP